MTVKSWKKLGSTTYCSAHTLVKGNKMIHRRICD